MNKTDLIHKIKQLEGISQDERSYLINLVNTKKKYGLVWEDKPEDAEEQLRTHLPVLREVVEKRIKAASPNPSEGGEKEASPKAPPQPSPKGREPEKAVQNLQQSLFEPETIEQSGSSSSPSGRSGGALASSPNHILIEGDNLHALTALTFTHEGKIDVIYIDPPYNTGNKDFKYNDSFVDREDSYRHSKWLSFMDKRLRIAKRLLSDKGVIFISIDDNEQAQLKMLCDEVFGEENYIGDCVWKRRASSGLSNYKFSKDHEYVKVYKKSSFVEFTGVKKTYEKYSNPDNDPRGEWIADNLTVGMGKDQRPNQFYVLANPETGLEYQPNPNRVWSHIPESMDRLIKEKRIIFPKSNNQRPLIKRFKNELRITDNPISSLINMNFDIGLNSEGTRALQDFGLDGSFVYPKPVTLVKSLVSIYKDENACILDFFAGSGTTLHATMQLNAEDGGTRQCILVTNNENNICEEVTYERNRRVIQGYTNSKGEWVNGLTNNNLRYYKSELVGREPSLKNKRELTRLATELLCIKEDCYEEQEIAIQQAKLFVNGKVMLLVLFDDHIIPDAVEFIKKQINGITIKVYVFSMGSDPYTEDFYEVSDKIELCALPDAIYKAYRSVLPKNKRFIIADDEKMEVQMNKE